MNYTMANQTYMNLILITAHCENSPRYLFTSTKDYYCESCYVISLFSSFVSRLILRIYLSDINVCVEKVTLNVKIHFIKNDN